MTWLALCVCNVKYSAILVCGFKWIILWFFKSQNFVKSRILYTESSFVFEDLIFRILYWMGEIDTWKYFIYSYPILSLLFYFTCSCLLFCIIHVEISVVQRLINIVV